MFSFFAKSLREGRTMSEVWQSGKTSTERHDIMESTKIVVCGSTPYQSAPSSGVGNRAMRNGHHLWMTHGRKSQDLDTAQARTAWRKMCYDEKQKWHAEAKLHNDVLAALGQCDGDASMG